MTDLHRRKFLAGSVGLAGAAAIAGPLRALASGPAPTTTLSSAGYGPLLPAADASTGLPLLHLPEGFRYASFGWMGDVMADGTATPGRHDGMAVVGQDGQMLRLVRNHEMFTDTGAFGPDEARYDAAAGGGTTTLRFDLQRGQFVDARVSLGGTLANCAGGPTPWGSWLSCEEVVADARQEISQDGVRRQVALQRDHGFVFEVPGEGLAAPSPLRALGRFAHEAVAVDPRSGIAYLTEDRHPQAGFYRFVPEQSGRLSGGGRLQMMRVVGASDLRQTLPLDRAFEVTWVDIEEPERGHTPGTLDRGGCVGQGLLAGGSAFVRLEGCWFGEGEVFFTSTSGGAAGAGQVFAYDPIEETLRLLFESPSREILDSPDNLTLSPRGGLLLCEDGGRLGQRLIGLDSSGRVFPFAANSIVLHGEQNGLRGDFRGGEWCGACFSPDGQWLFANLQKPGITVAITGPWMEGLL